MTTRNVIPVLATALVFAGCSKDETTETSEPSYTEGTQGSEQTTTSVEEWRSEEELPPGERVEDDGVAPTTGMTAPEMQSAAKAGTTLTDGEIAMVVEVVNTGEVEQAKLAKTKARDDRVKQFAERMITDHTKAKREGAQLVEQEQLVPQQNAIATELENGSAEMMQSLRSAEPEQFDRVYMDGQVEQHQKVLDMLDKDLIPGADDPELKAELTESRSMIAKHLDQAREIQRSLPTGD